MQFSITQVASQNTSINVKTIKWKRTMSVNEYRKEKKFLKSLTENNENILDINYFGYYNDFRKMSVPLAGIELPQSKTR